MRFPTFERGRRRRPGFCEPGGRRPEPRRRSHGNRRAPLLFFPPRASTGAPGPALLTDAYFGGLYTEPPGLLALEPCVPSPSCRRGLALGLRRLAPGRRASARRSDAARCHDRGAGRRDGSADERAVRRSKRCAGAERDRDREGPAGWAQRLAAPRQAHRGRRPGDAREELREVRPLLSRRAQEEERQHQDPAQADDRPERQGQRGARPEELGRQEVRRLRPRHVQEDPVPRLEGGQRLRQPDLDRGGRPGRRAGEVARDQRCRRCLVVGVDAGDGVGAGVGVGAGAALDSGRQSFKRPEFEILSQTFIPTGQSATLWQ